MKTANVRELWVIFECPHCNRPQTVSKYLKYREDQNVAGHLKNTRVRCDMCDKPFLLVLETQNGNDIGS